MDSIPRKRPINGSTNARATALPNQEHKTSECTTWLTTIFILMTKKEIIEDLCHKVADIKYDLQVVLDTLYQLDNEDNE